MLRALLAATITAVTLASTGIAQSPPDQARLDAFIAAQESKGEAPGYSAAAIGPDGRVLLSSAGHISRNGDTVTAQSRFLAGSVGKSFAGFLAAQLSIDGVLDLDAPISTWLADRAWFDDLANAEDITLRMLLNQTAGVPDYLEHWRFYLDRGLRGERGFTPDELVHYIAGASAENTPGESFSYSDTHFILAGLILEAASGETYTSLLETRIIAPMGLDNTTPLTGQRFANLAVGYDRGLIGESASGRPGELGANLDWEWAGGGLVSTPADLALFFHQLASEAYADERRVMMADYVVLNAELKIGYGLGIYVRDYEAGDYRLFHGGDFAGFRSAALYDSRTGTALALQANAKRFDAPDALLAFNQSLASAE